MVHKVAVAMSGGVDSSVSAFLLKEASYEVTGITMCLGVSDKDNSRPKCCGPQAIEDAKRVCDKLKISHYVIDYSRDLEEKVIANFVAEYTQGRTPNPCVDCNKYIKFGTLLEKIIALGFDYLATGHYAKIAQIGDSFFLKRAKDRTKDQTYFLYPIKKEHLKLILFPLAEFTKAEVREVAKKIDLPVAEKPQSQDICFIPNRNYRDFVAERIGEIKPGLILDLKGKVLGYHRGVAHYTIGQREGLGVSHKRALYVISINPKANLVIVGEKEHLRTKELTATNVNYLVEDFPETVYAKIRYNHREDKCKVIPWGNSLKVIFDREQEAVTPGQSIVFYDNDTCLGGGIIQ